ncbi:hypothetical protein TIFTF001_017577 [Ficus carica]|uniref:Uncharacterized protein n=1 Tax=Ficus carica TaxID=3494 RepID=A0AA88D9W3_FICCA|nr:hypothetical protein TIFTF001_017577 [Ficus carica]
MSQISSFLFFSFSSSPAAKLGRTFRLRLGEKWEARQFGASRGRRTNTPLVELTPPADPRSLVGFGRHERVRQSSWLIDGRDTRVEWRLKHLRLSFD